MLKKSDNYDNFFNCTNNGYVHIIIILKYLFLSFASSILLQRLISLYIWTILKPLFSQQLNNAYFFTQLIHFDVSGPSECAKSCFLTNLILYNFIFEKIYTYSPSSPQDLNQKLNKGFRNYKPILKMPEILNEEDIDVVIDEIGNDKDSQKSGSEIETYESIEELKYPQEYEYGGIIILDNSD